MMALDNTFLFSTQQQQQPFGHGGDACNELLINPLEMESTLSDFFEDDMFPWVENCKRRRLSPSCLNDAFTTGEDVEDLFESFWDSGVCGEVSNGTKGTDQGQGRSLLSAGASMQMQPMSCSPSPQLFHEESPSSDSSQIETLTVDPPTKQATLSMSMSISIPPCPSTPFKLTNSPLKGTENEKDSSRKRKCKLGIICPFVAVKPGGEIEGCVTLDDINRKLLTRPAKPVRHPVGEFACVPRASTSGLGLSGKTVVSLIRINTKGKGTVTIIRTR